MTITQKEEEQIINWFNKNFIDPDKTDIFSDIDRRLTTEENKRIIKEKYQSNFIGAELETIQQIRNKKPETKDEIEVSDWLNDSLNKSKIYGIVGSRGSGKSCLGFELLRLHKENNRKVYVYRFPKPSILPEWIHNITDISKADKNGVVLIDESGIEFNQFSFHTKKSVELANILKLARHRDLSIILISQNGATLTRDIRRLIDCYLLRNPSFTQLYDEISVIKRMYQNCFMLFATEDAKLKGFYITEIGTLTYFDKPEFFNDTLSKSYDGITEMVNISNLFKKRKI